MALERLLAAKKTLQPERAPPAAPTRSRRGRRGTTTRMTASSPGTRSRSSGSSPSGASSRAWRRSCCSPAPLTWIAWAEPAWARPYRLQSRPPREQQLVADSVRSWLVNNAWLAGRDDRVLAAPPPDGRARRAAAAVVGDRRAARLLRLPRRLPLLLVPPHHARALALQARARLAPPHRHAVGDHGALHASRRVHAHGDRRARRAAARSARTW